MDKATVFAIANTKVYVPLVTLSTEVNTKLLKQLDSGFKRTVNWLSNKIFNWEWKKYLDYIIDPVLQVVCRLFILSFKNITDKHVQNITFQVQK